MKHSRPADIERTSMAIIAEELRQRGIQVPPDQEAVVKRVIHTTADFEYAENLVFTKNAVSLGVAALRKGTPIVTDTNMAKAGISRPGLEKLGSYVMCFMADPAVAQRAEAQASGSRHGTGGTGVSRGSPGDRECAHGAVCHCPTDGARTVSGDADRGACGICECGGGQGAGACAVPAV